MKRIALLLGVLTGTMACTLPTSTTASPKENLFAR